MLKVSGVFSDHMVLQSGKRIPVWGTADPGCIIRAKLDGEEVSARAGEDGCWKVRFSPKEARRGLSLVVMGEEEEKVFSDVAVGEVWFAGGQSNMELPLIDSLDGRQKVQSCGNVDIRFYMVPKCAFPGEELEREEENSAWQVLSPATGGVMSAVAYYFAANIQNTSGGPVGMICCAWGGTSISCWMSRQQLLKSSAGHRYIEDYEALIGDKTDEQYRREMEAYNRKWEAWNSRVEARRKQDPSITWEVLNEECGLCPWPQPAGRTSPFRPHGLYETMVRRVSPYAVRGFLYYQGEEDEARYESYDWMMYALIDEWRSVFGDDTLPFLFVQLPMYIAKTDAESGNDSRHWAMMRDQQMKTARTIAHTGLAVLTDCGEFDNIHPLDKETVGLRLALQARAKVYGEDVTADGPVFSDAEYADGTAIVRFHHTGTHLTVKGEKLTGFEVAGKDGIFYSAESSAKTDCVHLTAREVPEPCYVRYAWKNYCKANLYGASGLPAAPFRTDEFPVS